MRETDSSHFHPDAIHISRNYSAISHDIHDDGNGSVFIQNVPNNLSSNNRFGLPKFLSRLARHRNRQDSVQSCSRLVFWNLGIQNYNVIFLVSVLP